MRQKKWWCIYLSTNRMWDNGATSWSIASYRLTKSRLQIITPYRWQFDKIKITLANRRKKKNKKRKKKNETGIDGEALTWAWLLSIALIIDMATAWCISSLELTLYYVFISNQSASQLNLLSIHLFRSVLFFYCMKKN